MLYLTGIIICFFLCVLLLSKKDKKEPDKILVIWLFLIGVHMLLFYIHVSGKYVEFPYLVGFGIPLPFVHPPFLYLYTASITNQATKKRYWFLHFLPILFTYFFFLPFLTSSFANKIVVYQNGGLGYEKPMEMVNIGIIISGIVYIILSLVLLKKHRKAIEGQFSNIEKINLSWLRYLTFGIGIIWLLIITDRTDEYIYTAVVFFILFIGFFGIKQVGIFTQAHQNNLQPNLDINLENTHEAINELAEDPKPLEEINHEKIKYSKSGLLEEAAQDIHKKLIDIMQKEKVFKNPELTLSDLSQKLGVNANTLSQVVNSLEEKNFYDYINGQRIEEFKRIVSLPENQKFTILALAYECGFNSKSAFNRNFKNETGLSPTEYLKETNILLG